MGLDRLQDPQIAIIEVLAAPIAPDAHIGNVHIAIVDVQVQTIVQAIARQEIVEKLSPDERRFGGHVFINMDPQNLERYSSYYQFHNPLSATVQKLRRAVRVNEIMPQRELIRTEFYNDFLARDGLYYGLNLYVHDGDMNIADMRIWRNRRRENFDDADLQILDAIKPHFCNSMKNALRFSRNEATKVSGGVVLIESDRLSMERIRSAYGLTAREAQIALEIAYGKTDHEIAGTMGVAFSTIRTHINHLYGKLGVRNRAALVRLICA